MAKTFTISDFLKQFPDDDTCLDHLMGVRYGMEGDCPKCGKHTKWHRIRKEPAYQCQWCGHHIHPMAGTPFGRTRTPLQKWFYAMFLFTTTRNGVAAKELQRQLGVTYKTAWRMGHEIRKYMAWIDGEGPLGRKQMVEIDKAYLGGRGSMEERKNKPIVLGMVERGGELVTRIVPDRRFVSVRHHIANVVEPGSRISTDESNTFFRLGSLGYRHTWVNHLAKEWKRGDTSTNTIEAFWTWLKKGISGTHVWVSKKHLPKYLGEFEYRFNMRKNPHLMFDLLIAAFPRP